MDYNDAIKEQLIKNKKKHQLDRDAMAAIGDQLRTQLKDAGKQNDVGQSLDQQNHWFNTVTSGQLNRWSSEQVLQASLERGNKSVGELGLSGDTQKFVWSQLGNDSSKTFQQASVIKTGEFRDELNQYVKANNYDGFTIGSKYSDKHNGEINSVFKNNEVTFKDHSGRTITLNYDDIELVSGSSTTTNAGTLGGMLNQYNRDLNKAERSAFNNQKLWKEACSRDAVFAKAGIGKMSDSKLLKKAEDKEWCTRHGIDADKAKIMKEAGTAGINTQAAMARRSKRHERTNVRTKRRNLKKIRQDYANNDAFNGVMTVAELRQVQKETMMYIGTVRDTKNRFSNFRDTKKIASNTKKINRLDGPEAKAKLNKKQYQERKKKLEDKNKKRQQKIDKRTNKASGYKVNKDGSIKLDKDGKEIRSHAGKKQDKKDEKLRKRTKKKEARRKKREEKFANSLIGKSPIGKAMSAIARGARKFFGRIMNFFSFLGKVKKIIIIVVLAFVVGLTIIDQALSGVILTITSTFSCFTFNHDPTLKYNGEELVGETFGEQMIDFTKKRTVELRDSATKAARSTLAGTNTIFFSGPNNQGTITVGEEGVTVTPVYYDQNGTAVSETAFYNFRDILAIVQICSDYDIKDTKGYYDLVKDIYNSTHHDNGYSVEKKDWFNANVRYCNSYNLEESSSCNNFATTYHSNEVAAKSAEDFLNGIIPTDYATQCNNVKAAHGENGIIKITSTYWLYNGIPIYDSFGSTDCQNYDEISTSTKKLSLDGQTGRLIHIGKVGDRRVIEYKNSSGGFTKILNDVGDYVDVPANYTEKKGYAVDDNGNNVMLHHYKETTTARCKDYVCGGHEHGCKGHIHGTANLSVDKTFYDKKKNGDQVLKTGPNDLIFFEKATEAIDSKFMSKDEKTYNKVKNRIDMSKKKNVSEWNLLANIDWKDVYNIEIFDGSTGQAAFDSQPLTEDQLKEIKKQCGDDLRGFDIVNIANAQVGAAYCAGACGPGTFTQSLVDTWYRPGSGWTYTPEELAVVQEKLGTSGGLAFDCSGLVGYCVYQSGANTNIGGGHSLTAKAIAHGEASGFTRTSPGSLKPGDVGANDTHTIIYAGMINGQPTFIEAACETVGVVVSTNHDLSSFVWYRPY